MSLENSPKITVITVTYNCKSVLQATIDSVAGQTYPNVEYIVIDGASTDGTVDIIKANADKITRWVSEPDKGIYDAMNKGISMATGQWVHFLNAGDLFAFADALFCLALPIDPLADIVYGNLIFMCSQGCYTLKPQSLEDIVDCMVFGHPATLVRRERLLETPFDTSFRIAADYNFFYQAYKRKLTFQYIDIDVAVFDGQGGVSSTNAKQVAYENARVKGLTSSRWWQITFRLECAVIRLKNATKKWLPRTLVDQIKHHNMKKLEG